MGNIQPVQTTSGKFSALASSLTLTFGAATTSGNTVVVFIGSYNRAVNAIGTGAVTIGTSGSTQADNFACVAFGAQPYSYTSAWTDPSCMGGANTIVISQGSNTDYMEAFAFELPGMWFPDQRVFGNAATGAWSSGETLPIPSGYTELALGFVVYNGSASAPTLTPPGGAWTNLTPLTKASTVYLSSVAGYADAASGSQPIYNGTSNVSDYWGSMVLCMTQAYTAQTSQIGVWRGSAGNQNPDGTLVANGSITPATAIANIQAYETWINREVNYVLDYVMEAPANWTQFEQAVLTGAGNTQKAGIWGSVLGTRTLCLSLAACAGHSIGSGASTWAGEAAGTNDAHWTALGNYLIAQGLGNASIRLGREFNGNWYNWAPPVSGDSAANYIAGYQHIVTLLRGLTGANFTFMWNPALGQGNLSSELFANWYPGNAYVDSIGFDMYDWGDYSTITSGNPGIDKRTLAQNQTNWNYLQTTTDGLNALVAFVTTGAGAGKPINFPEYGLLGWLTGGNYIGGGDDTFYINSVEPYIGASQWSAMWEDQYVGLFEADSVSGHAIYPDRSRQLFLTEWTFQPQIPALPVPTLPSLPAGYVVQAADMNSLGAAATFLLNRPITRVHDGVGGQAVGTAGVAVTFSVADFDSTGMWNITFPSQLTIVTPGYYKVNYMVAQNSGLIMNSFCQITTGPNNPQGASYTSPCWPGYGYGSAANHVCPRGQGIIPWYLYAGDIVQVFTFCNSAGGALVAGQGSGWVSSFLELEYVSV